MYLSKKPTHQKKNPKYTKIENQAVKMMKYPPGDDGRDEKTMEGVLGNSDSDREVIGGEQTEHGGDCLLHGVSGGVGDTL